MKRSMDRNIGVCSWSLLNDLRLLSMVREQTGIATIHLHIRPDLGQQNADFINAILNQGWRISSGMVSFSQEDYSTLETIKRTGGIVPDEHWPENQKKVFDAIDIVSELSVPYLSFHFGFLRGDNRGLIEKVRSLADYAGSRKIMLLMETGQETADELAGFIEALDHSDIGINFDPANMLLYGKAEPADSLGKLKKWVKHVHIKDAIPSSQPGQWGTEVPWGGGRVNSNRFLEKLARIDYHGCLCVEREQGSQRLEDIVSAIKKVKDFLEK